MNQVQSDTEQGKSLIPCDIHHSIDPEVLAVFAGQILSENKAQKMAEFFSLLGDSNRLRILSVLAKDQVCVCDLATTLCMSESAVSHQLRTLKAMRLVAYEKRGRRVYYSLLDHHVLDLYRAVTEHLDEID
ncbi:MAG: helix-turn-helix transcriptional regulator [Cyanobacterium sp. T60_A2020_053]|nr:helix-turn-helix transcriptional regulator [Cyanobacterium sp. T60_A2020_053]